MSADTVLSRLQAVRRTGPGRWLAKCPAHDDRLPSLSIRELEDGRTLLHDFAGCTVEQVLSAADLTFDDLFPEKAIADRVGRERRPFNAADILKALREEIDVAAVFVSDVYHCRGFTDEDYKRFGECCSRIREAERLANG